MDPKNQQTSVLNPANKCAQLFDQKIGLSNLLSDMFEIQRQWQASLAERGRAVDYDKADFKTRVDDLTVQLRNFVTEFTELLERLPFKEWRTYTPEQLNGFESREQMIETWYEYADMFHFFLNIGLALGIDGVTLEQLYRTKNLENYARQKRGY